jgi:RNA polymerase sigma-70 factor, ECF subfamily
MEKTGKSLDEEVRALLAAGRPQEAFTRTLDALGREVMGFLVPFFKARHDAEEVFAATCERLWGSFLKASFRGDCSVRTWTYVLARNEMDRFRTGERRRGAGRVPLSEIADIIAVATTKARVIDTSSERREKFARLRAELSPDDQVLLTLRVDRELPWDDVALAFVANAESCSNEERKREAVRLRKRYELLRKQLAQRVREEGLL